VDPIYSLQVLYLVLVDTNNDEFTYIRGGN
jgi:hypothetical protein